MKSSNILSTHPSLYIDRCLREDVNKKVNLIKSVEFTEWGRIYYYNSELCRFALYVYNDDKSIVYLSNVYVDRKFRECGIGNKILKIAQQEANKLGAKHIFLKCLSKSFVHEWYVRHGYKYFDVDDKDENYIWLRKNIHC